MAFVLLVFSTFLIGAISYYLWIWTYWRRRGMPGPLGYPIIGSFNQTLDDKIPPLVLFLDWTKKYGKMFGITEGTSKTIIISDPQVVQEVCVKQYDNFYGKKLNPIQGDPNKDAIIFLFGAHGYRWKRLRSISAPTFSTNSLKKIMGTIEDSAFEMIQIMEKTEGKSINIVDYFQEYTMDVIARIAMGQNGTKMMNNEMLPHLKKFFEDNRWPIWMMAGSFPPVTKVLQVLFKVFAFFGGGPFVAIIKVCREAIESRIKQRESDAKNGIEKSENPADFIDLFLDAHANMDDIVKEDDTDYTKNSGKLSNTLTIDEIIGLCFAFLLAGFDTTALSLSYTSFLLAKNPKVLKKLQEEVDRECDTESIGFDQLSNLKYMELVIKEALRLYPLGAVGNARCCMRSTTLGGEYIEEGTGIIIDSWSMHYDERVWGKDVKEFKPERWENETSEMKASYIPFGLGPRQCIGMRLAYMEEKLMLAHMLKKFDFELSQKTKLPLNLVGRSTIRPENLFLNLKPRY